MKHGPAFFRIASATDSAVFTHAGLLGYTAPEGTVVIPPHVAQQLGAGGAAGASVVVEYTRLPRGTFCRLQPRTQDFALLVDDVKGVVRANICLLLAAIFSLPPRPILSPPPPPPPLEMMSAPGNLTGEKNAASHPPARLAHLPSLSAAAGG